MLWQDGYYSCTTTNGAAVRAHPNDRMYPVNDGHLIWADFANKLGGLTLPR
jgi:hypothetical protein